MKKVGRALRAGLSIPIFLPAGAQHYAKAHEGKKDFHCNPSRGITVMKHQPPDGKAVRRNTFSLMPSTVQGSCNYIYTQPCTA